MFEDLLDERPHKKDPDYTGYKYIYTNESGIRVYVSKGGSILPNKYTLWED